MRTLIYKYIKKLGDNINTFKNMEKLLPICGIYMVINIINNKKYIGQSINIKKRFYSHHIYDYKNQNNTCYNDKFYQAIRKYGIENFKVKILEQCSKNLLNEREVYWILFFDTFKFGYNSTLGGTNMPNKIKTKDCENKKKLTRKENNSLKSENHPRAKLNNNEVIAIRQRYINGEDKESIYNDYKHLYKNIDSFRNIILGKSYKHLGNIPQKEQIRYSNKNKSIGRIDSKIIEEIRKEYKNKPITYKILAEKYNTSISTIGKIINFQLYKNIKK